MATNEGRRPVPRAIIEVRNLRKEYPVEDETVVALDRVNLSIPQGQICCIFGESGSGKSTLLNQLAGMEKPTRGGVRIGGVAYSNESGSAIVSAITRARCREANSSASASPGRL